MAATGHPSSSLFYFVAVALGLSFSSALLVLAWNNVLDNETRNFAFDVIAAQNSIDGSIRTADAVIDNTASFVGADASADADAFIKYTRGSLARYHFITGLAYARIDGAGRLELQDSAGTLDRERLAQILASGDSLRIVRQGLRENDTALPIVHHDDGTGASQLMLVQSVKGLAPHGEQLSFVALSIDLPRLISKIAIDPTVNLTLYTESEGIGGRRLVHEKLAREGKTGLIVETLDEVSTVRLGGFSVRLVSNKEIFWDEVESELFFVALILGLGITLLLIALARAKDIQARELVARNQVIEDQVERQTKDLAEARDAALEASRVKSDFLASMSHEIRTPLNAIIGMADLLSESKLDDEQEKYVGVFRNAGEALLSLVNDILDLSKIEAEQLSLESIDFDLVDIVEQAAEIYALKADARNVELITCLEPELKRQLVGDPGRLRQIILNLIGNAIKFTERGQIVVAVRPGRAADYLHFEVRDSGIGIPTSKLESIFSNFTQVDSSTTRKYGGTGLGLAICKRLVELMDGRIWVESEEGQGSQFHFEVALRPGATSSKVGGLELGGCQRVLIGATNAPQGTALGELFTGTSEEVAVVSDGDAMPSALEERLYTSQTWDLCVIDVGHELEILVDLITRVRANGQAVPIVTLFAPSSLAKGVEALRGVAQTSYVVKPVRRNQFADAVRLARVGPERDQSAVVDDSESKQNRSRILLVEDNPDNRLLVKAYLKQEPYEIVEAENGAEAVRQFCEASFDLVLMDVQMPVMDGHTATREIRAWERANQRPATTIVALTANAVKEDIDNSLAAGCDDHLTKPIKKKTLIEALRTCLAA